MPDYKIHLIGGEDDEVATIRAAPSTGSATSAFIIETASSKPMRPTITDAVAHPVRLPA
ncbi:MAG TPA: hypothetical protein VK738_00690 [Terriglobales bacterium]|nr:hypothetical protein [Terriglobales bacterium]